MKTAMIIELILVWNQILEIIHDQPVQVQSPTAKS